VILTSKMLFFAKLDSLVKVKKRVTPAKPVLSPDRRAGVYDNLKSLDSCFRRNDNKGQIGFLQDCQV